MSLYDLVSQIRRCGAVCWCLSMHAHSLDVAISVGPVGGAAVARLVDLALLLQAAGLAALARTTLNTERHACETSENLSPVKVLKNIGDWYLSILS